MIVVALFCLFGPNVQQKFNDDASFSVTDASDDDFPIVTGTDLLPSLTGRTTELQTPLPSTEESPMEVATWEIVLVALFVVLMIGFGCLFLVWSRNRKKLAHPISTEDENAGEPLLVPVEYF
jgi:hypothetical protein